MKGSDAEYARRLALRDARRAQVRRQAGFSDEPAHLIRGASAGGTPISGKGKGSKGGGRARR